MRFLKNNQPPGRHTSSLNLKFLRLCLNYRTHRLQPLTAEDEGRDVFTDHSEILFFEGAL